MKLTSVSSIYPVSPGEYLDTGLLKLKSNQRTKVNANHSMKMANIKIAMSYMILLIWYSGLREKEV
jgi:hypothetical protein